MFGERLNYDVISCIFDFLVEKDCYNLSISNSSIYKVVKNNGFLKYLDFNSFYPSKKFQDGYEIMKIIFMHKRRVEKIRINFVEDPVHWIPYWAKHMIFNRCKMIELNPIKPVNTEYIHLKCDNKININYEKFPKLKEIIINNK